MNNERSFNLLVYHIPHTCISVFKNILTNLKINYICVQNISDYNKIDKNKKYTKYFIARDPVERCIREYYDFKKYFHRFNKNKFNLKIHSSDYDSITSYFMNESRRNVMCKTLLGYKDFSCHIDDNLFNSLKNTLDSSNEYVFDIYSPKISFENFRKSIINVNVHKYLINYNHHHDKMIPFQKQCSTVTCQDMTFKLEKWNSYDMKLFNYLKNKAF